jgi:hypothetical protein
MKHLKMILTGLFVVAVVSGSLAFKAFGQRNLLFCSPTLNTCEFPTGSISYSTINNQDVVSYPTFTLYQEGTQLHHACSAQTPCVNPVPRSTTIYNNN